ncbi:MAG: YtxH domain-containing protein [Gemmatimonadales bacterium]
MADHFFDSDHQHDSRFRSTGIFLTGLGLGALLGTAVALLYAPESGEITRHRIRRQFRTIRDDAADELRDRTRHARRELRRRLRKDS